MAVKGLIFDLDGTLSDSLEDIGLAMNAALAQYGLPTHGLDAYLGFVGAGIDNLVRRASPESPPVSQAELVEAFRTHYREGGYAHTRPYEGIVAMLEALRAKGFRLAVLSNKREDFTRAIVKKQFGDFPFVEVRGERQGVPRKPDPQAALELAQVLGLPPGELAFVGDTAIDMKTAVSAGMLPVGVLWGFRGREELESAGAKHLLSKPAELLAVLEG